MTGTIIESSETMAPAEQATERRASTNAISESSERSISIILEFILFLIMVASTLSSTAISNIVLYRTCVHSLHHSVEECRPFLSPDKSNETKDLEIEVQRYFTYVSTVTTIIDSLGPALLCLFLGVWSNTYGRKPLIVWPLFGKSLSAILTVIYGMMDGLGPWWTIVMIIPSAVSGSLSVLIAGIYCSLSDMTTEKSRSIRMMTMQIAVSVGSVVGSLVSPHLLKTVGNVYVLLIAATLNVINYATTNIWLQESLVGAIPGSLSSVFDFALVKEMVTECFKRRPNNMRAQILLLTAANSLSIFVQYGLGGLAYMYTRRKLHWALKDFNQYSAINVLIVFIGSYVGVAIIQKRLKLSDLSVSVLSFASATADYAIKSFAVVSWHMYLGSAVSLFGSLSGPLIRSFFTKILPVEEIAQVFALLSAIEGIVPLISPAMYNALYNVTLSSFPGAIMLLTSFINGICMILLIIVIYLRWESPVISYQSVNSDPTDAVDNEEDENISGLGPV